MGAFISNGTTARCRRAITCTWSRKRRSATSRSMPHEPIKDTGLRRTYPNWVSREGARGMEYNAWGDPPNPPEHEVNLVFTRMLAGPMDFTPGVLSLTGAGGKRIQSTVAKQLALYVVLYSPIQMAADLPENYAKYPKPFQFIKDVPVDWSDTRVLNGEVGDYVTIARKDRNSDDWYLGAITDEQPRTLRASLELPRRGQALLRHDLSRRQERELRWRWTLTRDRNAPRVAPRHAATETGAGRRPGDSNFHRSWHVTVRGPRPSHPRRRSHLSSTWNEHARSCRLHTKPQVSFWQIWNMCFGFLGIQFGFQLQNSNVSRIFQTLGASIDDLPDPVGGGAADRAARAADHRLLLGSHLELARAPAAVFPRGRLARVIRARRDAAFAGAVDSRWHAVGPRRQHQHRDGAVPRVRRRSIVGAAAAHGLRDAELLHRRGRCHRGHAAVDFRACGREQRRHGRGCGGDSRHGALFIRHRRRRAGGRHAVDHLHDARVSARRAAWIRRFHAARRRCRRPAAPRTRQRVARCGSASASRARCSCGTSTGVRSSTSCVACSASGVRRC